MLYKPMQVIYKTSLNDYVLTYKQIFTNKLLFLLKIKLLKNNLPVKTAATNLT